MPLNPDQIQYVMGLINGRITELESSKLLAPFECQELIKPLTQIAEILKHDISIPTKYKKQKERRLKEKTQRNTTCIIG